jgi:hypothetical protein
MGIQFQGCAVTVYYDQVGGFSARSCKVFLEVSILADRLGFLSDQFGLSLPPMSHSQFLFE